ncbi:DVU0524 family FlgM-associated protein [Thermodesulfobacteriota bacterium]
MFIPSYQMHNVLNVYSKQLRHNITSGNKKDLSEKIPADQVSLTPEAKRQATIEKVSKDILEKITRFGTRNGTDQEPTERAKEGVEKETAADDTTETTFVFNVIDTINQKRRNTLSVEDSSFIIKRLEQLSKEVRDKNLESWV